MCDLEFTPNAGAASWWGWPCQTHRTDFTAHESNLAIPRLQRQRKKCSISGHYVKRGKRKMYSWISSYLPHCFQGAQDLRDAFDISISLPLGCMAPSYTLWCRQGQYRSKIVFGRQQTWQLPTLGSMWSLQGAAGAPSSELLSHAVPYRQQARAVGGAGWHS